MGQAVVPSVNGESGAWTLRGYDLLTTYTASLPHNVSTVSVYVSPASDSNLPQGRGWADSSVPQHPAGASAGRGLRNRLQNRHMNQLGHPHSIEARADSFPALRNTKPSSLEEVNKQIPDARLFSCHLLLKQKKKKKKGRLTVACHELEMSHPYWFA